jgi:hypothetical protein
MSVSRATAAGPTLSGREGTLVSVSIDVDPRYLEDLLEALARVEFPINPQIYHHAEMVYLQPNGEEETVSTTLVEFPAYAGRLEEVRNALSACGLDSTSVYVTRMLDEIHAESAPEPAPEGAGYLSRYRRKWGTPGPV